jgi:hypothetical protein
VVPDHRRRTAAAPRLCRHLPAAQAQGPAGIGLYQRLPGHPEHVALFKRTRRAPSRSASTASPRDLRSGHPPARLVSRFQRGLDLLLAAGIPVRLKAMVLRSNVHELPAIAEYCRARTHDYFRFDPLLHLRYDGDPPASAEIMAQRLSPAEIAAIEAADPERSGHAEGLCQPDLRAARRRRLRSPVPLRRGQGSFSVRYDGYFRLCASLNHPDTIYDLRRGSLAEAWGEHWSQRCGRAPPTAKPSGGCRTCPLINLCLWCPAHATSRPATWMVTRPTSARWPTPAPPTCTHRPPNRNVLHCTPTANFELPPPLPPPDPLCCPRADPRLGSDAARAGRAPRADPHPHPPADRPPGPAAQRAAAWSRLTWMRCSPSLLPALAIGLLHLGCAASAIAAVLAAHGPIGRRQSQGICPHSR